jgi:hypothetical protein
MAVKSELQQMHERNVGAGVRKEEVEAWTTEKRDMALGYLIFLKRKRCGKIKARGCADGRPQRKYIAKEDATSPTVTTEAVFITALIDAYEGRDVAVVDIPGAFMQTDMDEDTHIKITGKMVDWLIEVDRDVYGPCVTLENGKPVIYIALLKALSSSTLLGKAQHPATGVGFHY